MSLDLLTKMIEAACADGVVTSEELQRLQKKARELGINDDDLDFLIKGELDKRKSMTQMAQSGISQPKISSQDSNLSSGFVTSEENNEQLSGFVSAENTTQNTTKTSSAFEFTDCTLLSNQGAMSLVFKAKYLGKWIILKRLKPEHRNNAAYCNLFYKEFENAFHLDHPNIVRLISKGQDSEGPFYFMEFIDGRTLTEIITTNGITNHALVRKIATQILDALKYVHLKQVVHRDLKPDNILITFKGDNVKLLDFGLAAADQFEDDIQKAGTPKYAAPEQLSKDAVIDQRADIYSFGLILLEMLTGQIQNKDITRIHDQQLANIINKAIQPQVQNRFHDCDDILNLIKQTPQQTQIPKWLEEKVKECAVDGQISAKELAMLQMEAQNANVDFRLVQAIIDVEIERAQKNINKKREEQSAEETRNEKRKADLEREERLRKKENQKHEEELRRKLGFLSNVHRGQEPETNKTSSKKTIVWLLILAFIVVLAIILFRPNGVGRKWFQKKNTLEEVAIGEIYLINSKSLNLRSSPSKSNDDNVLDNFARGKEVEVIDSVQGWKKVRVNGLEGYMSSEFLIKKGRELSPTEPEKNKKNDKKKNDKNDETIVPDDNQNDNQDNNKKDDKKKEPIVVDENIRYIVVKTAPLRENKRLLGGGVIKDLEYGTSVQVNAYEGIWVKVTVDGIDGYVLKAHLVDKLPQR